MELTFFKAINAGVIIGIGGTCFLSIPDKTIGAFMFAVGLLTICALNQNLFTGKCSYRFNIGYLLIVLIGNIIGASLCGVVIGIIKPDLVSRAVEMCQTKMSEDLRLIPLGIFCNILIFFAVEGFRRGQTILLIMGIMAFILCGFEHCIANIFYFSVAKMFTLDSIKYLGLNILANWIGGLIVLSGKSSSKRIGEKNVKGIY